MSAGCHGAHFGAKFAEEQRRSARALQLALARRRVARRRILEGAQARHGLARRAAPRFSAKSRSFDPEHQSGRVQRKTHRRAGFRRFCVPR
jgi:hypothetical protein